MEFKEFEPRFKSAKTRFKLSAGLNLETFDTILSGTNHIMPRLKFKPPLKFFNFGHWSLVPVERHHVAEHVTSGVMIPMLTPIKLKIFILNKI